MSARASEGAVASLVIYCGNTLLREVKLPEGILRVGRSDQNDIVLVDPAKAVSRFHAELRVEHGECSVVDLNSQNGTWVAGRRVQQVRLAPGTSVQLGTYRLVFAEEVRQPATAEPIAPVPDPAPGPPADALIPPPPPATPVAVATRPAPRPFSGPEKRSPSLGRRRKWGLAAAAAACLVLTGFAAGSLWPRSTAVPTVPVAGAEGTVLGGPPTQTPGLDPPVPSAVPAEPAPVSRARVPQPQAAAPRPDPLDAARLALRRGNYQAAVATVQAVLRNDASNDQALELLSSLRTQGHDAFKRARQADAAGRVEEAARLYEKALKLLPADHPSAIAARERLLVLGVDSR